MSISYQEANEIMEHNDDWDSEKQKKWEEMQSKLDPKIVESKVKAVFDAISDLTKYTQMSPEEVSNYLSETSDELYDKWVINNKISDVFFP